MYKLFLCWRYLRKRRIAFFGVAAVGLCVALLIVVTSLFNGFIASFEGHWQQRMGQVILQCPEPLTAPQWRGLSAQLEKIDDVASAMVNNQTGGLLYLGRGNVRAVEIVGVEPEKFVPEAAARGELLLPPQEGMQLSVPAREKAQAFLQQRLQREITENDLPVGAIVSIGLLGTPDELSDQYDRPAILAELEKLSHPYTLNTGQSRKDAEGQSYQKITKTLWPVNVIATGMYLDDTRAVYVPFEYVGSLTGPADQAGETRMSAQVRIIGKPETPTDKLLEQVRLAWRQYARDKLTWPEHNIASAEIVPSMEEPRLKLFTHEIRKQLALMQLIVGLICLVAALLIFVILVMIVMQKKKDIGILRAVGASRTSLAGLFLAYGGIMGAAGAMAGVLLGVWATENLALIEAVLTRLLGFKIWKSGVYMFSEIPHQVDWSATFWIVLVGIATALLGALLPAVRAAKLQPVEALRYE